MTKNELLEELDEVNLSIRELMEKVEDPSFKLDVEEVRSKREALNKRKSEIKKELAFLEAPSEIFNDATETRSGRNNADTYKDVVSNIQKRTAVTLSGTGGIYTVQELVKKISDKLDILNEAKYFYGANSSTNVPVWPSHCEASFVSEGGTASAQSKSLGATVLTPKQAMVSLPISQMALDLSASRLESELPDLFATSFGDLMLDGMLNGSSGNMTGLFEDFSSATEQTTAYSKPMSITNLAGLAETLMTKNYAKPCIVMNPTVYASFLADDTDGEDIKIYKECLIRDKQIEGVPVILTGKAPSTMTTGSVVAVAGDLSNYAIAVAGEMNITPKQTASSSVVTVDAISYFTGKPVIASDFIQYIVSAS